ncbi:unnamed protein product [Moneuplotes crassus]|uniref:Uncharacterized protein n=1 Tax=Euplotes crassus TaxID=5936 RepID=A0AAD2D4L5_EUPCR|nr:unnamed protein product [Moneuplotes crassus]
MNKEDNTLFYNRRYINHDCGQKYDEDTFKLAEDMKKKLEAKCKPSEDDLYKVHLISTHYYHMLMANWELVCTRNDGVLKDLIFLYKSLNSLITLVDGLNKDKAASFGILLPFIPFKDNLFGTQQWMFETLNHLEAFLIHCSDSRRASSMSDLDDEIYASYYLFDLGIKNLSDCIEMQDNESAITHLLTEVIQKSDVIEDILTMEYIVLQERKGNSINFRNAKKHVTDCSKKSTERFKEA